MADNSDQPGAVLCYSDLLTLATHAGDTLNGLLERMRAVKHPDDWKSIDDIRQALKQVQIDLAAMREAYDEIQRARTLRLGIMQAQGASDLSIVMQSEPDGLE